MMYLLLLVMVWGINFSSVKSQTFPDPSEQYQNLYPYGPDVGDTSWLSPDDAVTGAIDLDLSYTLGTTLYNQIFVSSNGYISFGYGAGGCCTPSSLPRGDPKVFSFYSDHNAQYIHLAPHARIYYRQTTDQQTLNQATLDVRSGFGSDYNRFIAQHVFIATWHKTTHFASSNSNVNTHQIVLVTDGSLSLVRVSYGDIQWSRGSYHGLAGYDAGDNVHYLALPGSFTSDVVNWDGLTRYFRIGGEPAPDQCGEVGPAPQLRLTYGGQGNPLQGNAEIRLGNQWYSICSRGWGDEDATVFCNQLGFPGPAQAKRNAYFRQNDDRSYAMDRVRCTGNEVCLLDCLHRADPPCGPGKEAGVICHLAEVNRRPIRLVGSQNDGEGNVEISRDGQFEKICDVGWGQPEADLVCRELGYSGGMATRGGYVFNNNADTFSPERYRCEGTEETIFSCITDGEASDDCVDGREAGVICNEVEHPIRLWRNGAEDDMEGNVEILIGSQYHRVCDIGWSQAEAQFVCEQLGYFGTAVETRGSAYGDRAFLSFFTFRCDGSEAKFANCLKPDQGESCSGGAAGVICANVVP